MSISKSSVDPNPLSTPRLRSTNLPEFDEGPRVEPEPFLSGHPILPEDMDINDFSPAQLHEMNQRLFDESMANLQPPISQPEPISSLRDEYLGSTDFIPKINTLEEQGYKHIIRSRRDGNCFYRSLAFAYIQRLIRTETSWQSAQPNHESMFKAAGFAEFIYADLLELVAGLATSDRLWGDFTDEHKSASIVMYMRLLTSAHIRANCESLAGFIHDPESSGSELTVGQFCEMYVEPMGKEADNVQIYALVRALGVDIRIADITEHNTKGEVPFIDPGQEERSSPEADGDDGTLVLLFRPGHYDIIQKTLFE